jgi:ribosomal protein S18 acetylase RimI-like enzyme
MDVAALTLAAARNGANRQAAAFDAVGAGNAQDDDAWWATEPGPAIYHDWIVLRPAANAGGVAGRLAAIFDARRGSVSVLDPWAELDLAGFGFTLDRPQQWYVREPGAAGADGADAAAGVATPPELDLRPITGPSELVGFERTMAVGFGAAAPAEGSLLGRALTSDTQFRFWLGFWRGEPVVTATAVLAGGVVGIYDVATLPHARRRGFASAATCAALAAAPGLPAVLEAAPDVATLYGRLGFREFAVFRTWRRPAPDVRA